jgi:hypothetical protein
MTSSEFEQDIHDFIKYDTIKPGKNVINDAGSAEFNAPQEESFAEGAKIPEDR